jgi:hypothetical protein
MGLRVRHSGAEIVGGLPGDMVCDLGAQSLFIPAGASAAGKIAGGASFQILGFGGEESRDDGRGLFPIARFSL